MPSRNNSGRGDWVTIALAVGALTAGCVAVGVVAALFWWADSLPSEPLQRATAPAPITQPAWRDAAAEGSAAPAPLAVPHNETHPKPVAQQAHAAAPSTSSARNVPPTSSNSDAEKNHAIAAGLSRLGADPEAARRFGVPP